MTAVDDLKRLAGLEPYRAHLKLERGADGSFKALCPFHADKNPSLAVYEDGHFHCYGCEAHGDALDFLQKAESIDFAGAKKRIEEIVGVAARPRDARRGDDGLGKLVATYPYVDEEGTLLFEVQRYYPKTFRQRRKVGDGWSGKLGDVRKPLYRLAEVLQTSTVWLVEGEKDVETLRRFGLTATTTAGGANAPWLSEYSDALTGKTVYIVPDNDEPGRKRAQRIHRQLQGHADQVLIVEIPDAHKDVTDFIEAGNSGEDLRALIAAARSTPIVEPSWFESIATLGSLKSEPVRYLVPQLVPDGAFVLIVGRPGAFKSFLSLDICRAVSSGASFAGAPKTKARPALYLDAENSLPVVVARREFLACPDTPRLRYWGRFSDRPLPKLDEPELLAFAAKEKPLIVVDSFIRFHKGSENDNAEVAATMAHFLNLTRAGATVVLLHHAGKDREKPYRGAMEIEAAPDLCMTAERIGDREVRLAAFKNRFGAEGKWTLRLSEFGFQGLTGSAQEGDDAPI